MLLSRLSLSLLLAFASVVVSSRPTTRTSFVTLEERSSVPPGFTFKGTANASTPLTLRIALTSRNISGLEDVLYDVSNPSSLAYGKYLSKEEVEAYVAPAEESTSAVNEWLKSNGLTSFVLSPSGNWLSINTTVSTANGLLATTFNVYTHETTGKETIRTLSYSVPEGLRGDIELIHPTTAFPTYHNSSKFSPASSEKRLKIAAKDRRTEVDATTAVPSSCATNMDPTCVQALYAIPSTPAAATQPSNGIAVSAFYENNAQFSDLESFLSQYRPDMPSNTTFSVQEIDGGTNPQGDASLEANLDVQYTVGIATNVPVTLIAVGADTNDGDLDGYLDLVNYLLSEENPPWVMTTSYGFDEPFMPYALANNLCNAYLQLGARGVSAIFAAGDAGVGGAQPQSCLNPNTNTTTFLPTFPSTCPYVTSVGGTTSVDPELAWDGSAGGFSNYFGVPAYQQGAVESYLDALEEGMYEGLFNATGRAFPDVSAQADWIPIIWNGDLILEEGTSCASPIFTSVIALLNEQLLTAGRSTLGFLNPLLYANPGAFNDILSGSNPGCGTNGFNASVGWDPVTGLGTPNYTSLLSIIGV